MAISIECCTKNRGRLLERGVWKFKTPVSKFKTPVSRFETPVSKF
jgi:hypothetical protein